MKRRLMYFVFGLFAFAHLLPFIASFAQDSEPVMPALDALESGWNTLVPGGDTICSRGTPYQFFVRKAENTEKLLVYFQGGGACWNALTCRAEGGTFDDSVGPLEQELGFYDGIFNYDNPQNPLIDYNVVFIPYCTGDIHLGDNDMSYLGGVTIEHRGADNTMATLNWAFENFSTPESIVVAGTSAGAYGAVYYTDVIADQYPDANIVQHGDAGVGVSPVGWDVLKLWDIYANIPQFETPFDPETFELKQLYLNTAQAHPNVRLSQYTTAADDVQVTFYTFSAPQGAAWADLMYASLDALDELPNFNSYVSGGASHTILARPEFYTLTTNGVKFIDWFNAVLAGEDVENVRCENEACDAEEFETATE